MNFKFNLKFTGIFDLILDRINIPRDKSLYYRIIFIIISIGIDEIVNLISVIINKLNILKKFKLFMLLIYLFDNTE